MTVLSLSSAVLSSRQYRPVPPPNTTRCTYPAVCGSSGWMTVSAIVAVQETVYEEDEDEFVDAEKIRVK